MLLRRSTDIHPKELARDMRQFFNSLLAERKHFEPAILIALGKERDCRWQIGADQGYYNMVRIMVSSVG